MGETDIVHRDDQQGDFDFTFQHAPGVHCIILSVRNLVRRGCRVSFRRGGGTIRYPDCRKIRFIERLGVFFVALNVLDPGLAREANAFGPEAHDAAAALREPGFARQVRSG